jgi:hypothetical protein
MKTFSLRAAFALLAFLCLAADCQAAALNAAPDTLAATLAKAAPGDAITLAPGAYGRLSLGSKTFDPPITITGKGAVFSGLNLQAVQGVNVVGLEFNASCGAGSYPLIALGSKNLRFEGLNIHGDTNCWAGLLLRESSFVTVTKSEIHHLGNGVSRLNTSDTVISDNILHDLSSDAINGGGGSNISILRNRMTDFRPPTGAHPDGIQFWTTSAPAPASNILIQGNVISRGTGDVTTVSQGIFVELDSPDRRWSDVRILDNTILGGMYNGIFADGVDGLTISGNTVAGFPDMENWIRVSPGNTAVKISGNTSQRYIDGKADLVVDATNRTIPSVKDGGAAILAALKPVPPPVVVVPVPTPPAPTPAPLPDIVIKLLPGQTVATSKPGKTYKPKAGQRAIFIAP